MSRIVFLNTTIITTDGSYNCHEHSLDHVRSILSSNPDMLRLSAVGHDSTAQIMTELFGEAVATNRIQYAQEVGDIAICFKLSGRPVEGAILSREEIEKLGYSLKLLIKTA
jgi:hypothetical protein